MSMNLWIYIVTMKFVNMFEVLPVKQRVDGRFVPFLVCWIYIEGGNASINHSWRTYPMIDVSTFDNPWVRVRRRLSTGNGVVLLDGEPLLCASRLSPRQEPFLRNHQLRGVSVMVRPGEWANMSTLPS